MAAPLSLPATAVDAVLPTRAWYTSILLALVGSAVLALISQIAVPLPPVPITLQTLGVLLIGFLYGSRLGALTVLVYLLEGAFGLPVFAGGTGGIAKIVGPTGGYLIGFVFAAYLVGWLTERGWSRNILTAVLAALAGSVVLYIPGLYWLNTVMPSFGATLGAGLLPFLIGDGIKTVLAAIIVVAADRTIVRKADSLEH